MNETVLAKAALRVRHAAADGGPEALLETALQEFGPGQEPILHAVDFELTQYWRDQPDTAALVALYGLERVGTAIVITAAVVETMTFEEHIWPEFQRIRPEPEHVIPTLEAVLARLGIPCFRLDRAVPLQPVAIPKPWGQEIWYTGIERRGVAGAGTAAGTVPLPWLLAIAPSRLLGAGREPILLKILDPLPEPVYGDLYFEMHQQKQEVYVVTAIDANAWPAGEGAIRFGFDTGLRAGYADDRAFLADYLAAVRAYRAERRDIDRQLDARRAAAGIALDAPLQAATLRDWLADLPAATQVRERELRAAMERFTGMRPLQLGDVVKVPCLVPHSLQHGVRTVEFQTPVYERLILSFAQKVLTQADWDTEAAATLLHMDPPPPEPLATTASGAGWVEERIVEFDDFEVVRITLQAGATRLLSNPGSYALLMAVGSGLWLADTPLAGDAAVLLPVEWAAAEVANRGARLAYLLLAVPTAARG
jgi:hypothetical protein